MKKIILPMVSVSLLFACNALAGSATGTTSESQALQADTPATAAIARASKNVKFGWNTVATSYTINTFHTSGTKCYGSGSDSTKIYFKPCAASDTLTPNSSIGSGANGEYVTGWTAM